MLKTLTQHLTPAQQSQLLSQSLTRGGKGLEASDPFYQLPTDTILESALLRVLAYENSFADKRLSKLGKSLPTTIWCDRFAELAIFLRGLVGDAEEFETHLLQKYPHCNQSQLCQQSGGLALGYWHLAALIDNSAGITESTLRDLIKIAVKLIPLRGDSAPRQDQSWAEELSAYTKAKSGRNRQQLCAISGAIAEPIKSAGRPTKANSMGTSDRYAVVTYPPITPRSGKPNWLCVWYCSGKTKNSRKCGFMPIKTLQP